MLSPLIHSGLTLDELKLSHHPIIPSSHAVMSNDTILIASDHAGFELKEKLEAELRSLGYDVQDLGPSSDASIDYADTAHPLAKRVSEGTNARGVLLCGTGLGMSYTANRYPHVRAAVAWTPEIAALSREHNDANVLVLPARFVGEEDGRAILRAWLDTPFAGGRHARRVEKIERDPI
jgi:ribose 5-phosphate isomerase B